MPLEDWKPAFEIKPGLGFDAQSTETGIDTFFTDLPESFREKLGPIENIHRYVLPAVRNENLETENPDQWIYDNLIHPYIDSLENTLQTHLRVVDEVRNYYY